jgi:hypothetical protein
MHPFASGAWIYIAIWLHDRGGIQSVPHHDACTLWASRLDRVVGFVLDRAGVCWGGIWLRGVRFDRLLIRTGHAQVCVYVCVRVCVSVDKKYEPVNLYISYTHAHTYTHTCARRGKRVIDDMSGKNGQGVDISPRLSHYSCTSLDGPLHCVILNHHYSALTG